MNEARPNAEIGPGYVVRPFTQQRFSNAIQHTLFATHARQVVRDDMTSSFVLNFEPGGAATLARGWRYRSSNDGPKVHTAENLREQFGYRGNWTLDGDWVRLDLKIDESVCKKVGEYSNLIPNHVAEWHLRCLPVQSTGTSMITSDLLACRVLGLPSSFGEDGPHQISQLMNGEWIVLGAGNGLRIHSNLKTVSGRAPPEVQAERSATPVKLEDWEKSF